MEWGSFPYHRLSISSPTLYPSSFPPHCFFPHCLTFSLCQCLFLHPSLLAQFSFSIFEKPPFLLLITIILKVYIHTYMYFNYVYIYLYTCIHMYVYMLALAMNDMMYTWPTAKRVREERKKEREMVASHNP